MSPNRDSAGVRRAAGSRRSRITGSENSPGDVGRRLSRPVRGTLFPAGEAADSGGRNGTVHGAIGSGFDAARRLLRAPNRA